jgi:hypothetical protein
MGEDGPCGLPPPPKFASLRRRTTPQQILQKSERAISMLPARRSVRDQTSIKAGRELAMMALALPRWPIV